MPEAIAALCSEQGTADVPYMWYVPQRKVIWQSLRPICPMAGFGLMIIEKGLNHEVHILPR